MAEESDPVIYDQSGDIKSEAWNHITNLNNPRRAVMGEVQREALAKIIASAMGDNYADTFKNKQRWIAKRGQSGGRFRDVNEPYQSDYLDAADAAIAFLTTTGGHNAD